VSERLLTDEQVEALWVAAGSVHRFLTEQCERWLDGIDRESTGRTIRSYIKGSRLEALVS
jgi:hypothetical protein